MGDSKMRESLLGSGYSSIGTDEKGIETIFRKFETNLIYIFQFNSSVECIGAILLTKDQLETIYQSPVQK